MKWWAGFSNEMVILTSNKQVAVEAMSRHHFVSLRMFDDKFVAYCAVSRGLIMAYGLGISIPKYEDLVNYGYVEYSVNNTQQLWGVQQRFFAIVSDIGSAIATDFQYIYEFLSAYESTVSYIEIREFQTQETANQWRNCMYVQLIAPFLPYFQGTFPIINRVEANKTVAVVDYKKLLKEQRTNIPKPLFEGYSMPAVEPIRLLPGLID